MRLAGLTALEGDQLRVREAGLLATIRKLRGLLANESLQLTVMLKELDEVVERYGDARRTVILEGKDKTDFAYVKSSVADEDVVVTISQQGYLKRIPMHLYRRRTAAGLAMAAMERYRGDYLETVVVARTRGWLLAFTSKGKVYFLRVEEVPEGSRAARGKSIWALLGIDRRDPIIAVRPVDDLTDDRYLAFVTRAGLAKRTRLHEYSNPKPAGIIAIRLRQDDTVLDVHDTSGDTEFLLVTRQGRALRFPEREVPVRGRVALGVKGISLRGEDEVVAFIAAMREAPVLSRHRNGRRQADTPRRLPDPQAERARGRGDGHPRLRPRDRRGAGRTGRRPGRAAVGRRRADRRERKLCCAQAAHGTGAEYRVARRRGPNHGGHAAQWRRARA